MAPSTTHYKAQTQTQVHSCLQGKRQALFNLSGSGAAPVSVILNAVKSEADNYTVNINNSAGANLFTPTGQFSFNGKNTELVLNDSSIQYRVTAS